MPKKFDMKSLLNQQSLAAPDKPEADAKFHDIPIGKIKPSPLNKYDVSNIESLAADIEEMGLLHNLVVKPADANGMYEIISGERRYRACMMLYESGNQEYATLPCKISGTGNTAMDELMLLAANASARELSDYEKVWQAGRIKELLLELKKGGHTFKGRMRGIIADALDVSPAQVGRMEKISKNLAPEAMDAFKKGEIGITKAYDIAGLRRDAQAAALEEASAGSEAAKEWGNERHETKEKAPTVDTKEPPREKKPEGDELMRREVAILLRAIAKEIEDGKASSVHDAKDVFRKAALLLGVGER